MSNVMAVDTVYVKPYSPLPHLLTILQRDFHAPSPSDPAPLQVERANFASYLAKWLSE